MKNYKKPNIKVHALVDDEQLMAATGGPGAEDYGSTPGTKKSMIITSPTKDEAPARHSLFDDEEEE